MLLRNNHGFDIRCSECCMRLGEHGEKGYCYKNIKKTKIYGTRTKFTGNTQTTMGNWYIEVAISLNSLLKIIDYERS